MLYKKQEKRSSKMKLLKNIGFSVTSITLCVALTGGKASADLGDFLTEFGTPPPGANKLDCKLDAAHPEPVVLVHGTNESMLETWFSLSPLLAAKGYCVYALNYGNRATSLIENSAQELSTFVNKVLALTGAQKVSLIGHSQGGMMPRYYIKFLGGNQKVSRLIGIVPSNHGTTLIEPLRLICTTLNPPSVGPACDEQEAGSGFITNLNQGDETPGPVSYTVIATRYDEIVVPYTSAFLNGPAERVINITLQDSYPLDLAGHITILQDSNAFTFVYDALALP